MVRRNTVGHVHIFPYAVRQGTRAARMDGKCDAHTIRDRRRRLQRVADDAKLRYRQSLRALPHTLLTESEVVVDKTYMQGYSQYYVPIRTAKIQSPRRRRQG